jgi:signal transduction histidine kinase
VLARLSRVLGPAQDLQFTVESVLDAMRELLEFRGGSICLADQGFVRIAVSDPPVSPEVLAARVPVGSGIAGRIVAEGRTINVPDLDADPRVDPALRRTGSNAAMHSYLGVPLVFLGETIGVLQIDASHTGAFDDDDVQVLEWLSVHVSGAIGNARTFERMRELELLKNDFITRVSHELRTPLTVIRGFVATLLARPAEPEQQADMLRRIAANSARLEDLIEDLLALTAVEAGVRAPVLVDVPLAKIVATMDPGGEQAPVDPELIVRTDPDLLRRALHELVVNARTYAGAARISVVFDPGGSLAVEVRDDGPGIPAGILVHAGERFLRGGVTEGAPPGLGLGLYRVQRIADALGARLSLDCAPAGGTIARIHLPGPAEPGP